MAECKDNNKNLDVLDLKTLACPNCGNKIYFWADIYDPYCYNNGAFLEDFTMVCTNHCGWYRKFPIGYEHCFGRENVDED